MKPSFNIKVNNRPVPMTEHRTTGTGVKQAALAAGVEIGLDFQLSVRRPNGRFEVIGDDDPVTATEKTEFRAIAPDDNS